MALIKDTRSTPTVDTTQVWRRHSVDPIYELTEPQPIFLLHFQTPSCNLHCVRPIPSFLWCCRRALGPIGWWQRTCRESCTKWVKHHAVTCTRSRGPVLLWLYTIFQQVTMKYTMYLHDSSRFLWHNSSSSSTNDATVPLQLLARRCGRAVVLTPTRTTLILCAQWQRPKTAQLPVS